MLTDERNACSAVVSGFCYVYSDSNIKCLKITYYNLPVRFVQALVPGILLVHFSDKCMKHADARLLIYIFGNSFDIDDLAYTHKRNVTENGKCILLSKTGIYIYHNIESIMEPVL